ncbi:MAG: hypothetical protein WBP41_14830, partial [Saprospiraceae bacterium]
MQMFKITGVGSDGENEISPTGTSFRIYFQPLATVSVKSDLIPYLKGIHGLNLDDSGNIIGENQSQVFFKANMEMKPSKFDFISGYARIMDYDVIGGKPYIEVAPYRLNNTSYHPFCAGAWEKMRIEYPHLISPAEFEDENQSFKEVMGLFKAASKQILDLFRDFYGSCISNHIAERIDLDMSRIRLTHPGTGKYGGNSRVSKIKLTDNWEDIATYGQTYDYTMIDENGNRISSGVAENEPMVGYEECALRYAESYPDQIPIQTTEVLMFEYPLNDAYLPAPNVGYRKVTVRSLAGQMQRDPDSELPANFSTSGYTEHEFYTAKDFPILFGQTNLESHYPNKPKWTTYIGINKADSYSGSQGYAITLNDMHGKPLSVTQFGQDKLNRDQDQIVNRTTYSYFEGDTILVQQLGKYQKTRTLKNTLPALMEYAPNPEMSTEMLIEDLEFGVDREFFLDMRRSRTEATSVKFDVNIVFSPVVSIFGIPIPLPGGFGAVQQAENETRTVVANKIIYKTGILKEIDVFDGQSHLKTNQLVFDKITGQPVLTSINNAFDNLIYSFQLPAHYVYDGMSDANQNYRIHFTGDMQGLDECSPNWQSITDIPTPMHDMLIPGDELLIIDNNETQGTFTVHRIESDHIKGNAETEIPEGTYTFLLLRSGARNLLNLNSLSITALSNPTRDLELLTPTASVPSPDGTISVPLEYFSGDGILSAQATRYHKTPELKNYVCLTVGRPRAEDLTPPVSITGSIPVGHRWQPYCTYEYIDQREGFLPSTTDEINIVESGIVNNVPFFDFDNPFFTNTEYGNKWIATQHVNLTTTESNCQETLNAIGTYSVIKTGYASVFANNNKQNNVLSNLPILVAENANQSEVAFESFEENSWISNAPPSFSNATGGFTFARGTGSRFEKYPIMGGIDNHPGSVAILKEYDNTDEPPVFMLLDLSGPNNTSDYIQVCLIRGLEEISIADYDGEIIMPFSSGSLVYFSWPETCPEIDAPFTGDAILIYTSDDPHLFADVGARSNTHAHTGKFSYLPTSGNERRQHLLNLKPNKKYVFEGWIHIPVLLPAYTYPDHAYVIISDEASSFNAVPTGNIIEGWQQIRCEFEPLGYNISLSFNPANEDDVYFDDLRLSPLEAGVKSYVYEPDQLRLVAELDENNFATLYSYDQEGKLVLIRKETERGIKSIQESRSHIQLQ